MPPINRSRADPKDPRVTKGLRRPYIISEHLLVKRLVESALESGISYSDSVRLAIAVYREIDVLARDEKCNILSRFALRDIREYCCAILRSGTTFSAFQIATRAVAAWRLTVEEIGKLHDEWDLERVSERLQKRRIRQDAAALTKGQVSVFEPDVSDVPADVDASEPADNPNSSDAIDPVIQVLFDPARLRALDDVLVARYGKHLSWMIRGPGTGGPRKDDGPDDNSV